jgi:hypothetical protein
VNELIRKFERISHIDVYGLGTDREKWELTLEKFTHIIADHCASICMSQADRRNIRNAFGIPEESNIKYKGPDPSNSIESQYNRELNTTRIQ